MDFLKSSDTPLSALDLKKIADFHHRVAKKTPNDKEDSLLQKILKTCTQAAANGVYVNKGIPAYMLRECQKELTLLGFTVEYPTSLQDPNGYWGHLSWQNLPQHWEERDEGTQ